ncbi:hypothetical protein IC235_06415 [Hymenobacter sp. BT664]|uniref:Periplasmic heavy metal sensor n=1 Tax=Hymenobacter montanus TaxID=2771359 RepID=A0A927BCG0_9BACT|nr:hypothetical protein [Hymenobacter montanus]MBD2767522.1 hypothetical protein [Hymenobacter montanus]
MSTFLLRFTLLPLLAFLLLTNCTRRARPSTAPVAATARPPESPTPASAARDLADVMATDLQLTPEQTSQVRTILNRTVQEANAAKAKYPPQSSGLLTELKRINADSQKGLLAVLGPVKFKQLRANQRKMAEEMQQRQK